MDADEKEKRRKLAAAAFWPRDARSFVKKFATDHPDAWAVLLAFHDGDKADVLAMIDHGLHEHEKWKRREANELAEALLRMIPELRHEQELKSSVNDYWRQRLFEDLMDVVADQREPDDVPQWEPDE